MQPQSKVKDFDISADGIGILRSQSMPLDEPFIACLPGGCVDGVDQPVTAVLATVAYWEPIAERLFSIGCRFDRILSQGELEDAGRTLARAATLSYRIDETDGRSRRRSA